MKLLTEKYGIAPEDIIIDPLVFPCATGDENYIGGAVETIDAIRLIKEKIPYVKTILGVSNISFGLPASAREVVNSVFLYYATKAGLDLAIVNAEKLERFASIPGGGAAAWRKICCSTRRRRRFDRLPEDWREQIARAEERRSISSTSPRSPIISARPSRRTRRKPPNCRSMSVWRITSSKAPKTG